MLLHFFEAFVQFVFTIMISALRSNTTYFNEHRRDILVDDGAAYLKRSSFGAWVTLGSHIAKMNRKEISSPEEQRDKYFELYSGIRKDFVSIISSKKIFDLLITTNDYRNRWKGHGGIESQKDISQSLALLENQLSMLREILEDCFTEVRLFKPGYSEFSGGIYQYSVTSLTGTRTMFKKFEMSTSMPLDKKKLFFASNDSMQALELVPLLKFRQGPSSEENACYFYNRMEKNGVRWVSYHFDKESDVVESDDVILEELRDIIEM